MNSRRVNTVLGAVTIGVYLFLFGPLVIAILLAFSDASFAVFPIKGFSLKWFYTLANNTAVLHALGVSILLGIVAATIAVLIGVPAAMALNRYQLPGSRFINFLIISPILIPETILAVGLLLLLQWGNQPRSIGLLLCGHVMLSVPYVVLIVQARLVGVKQIYEDAARSLGANNLQTFREVTLPLMMPAVGAGGLLAFVLSFDNITATLFWRPGGIETVPTTIYGMLRDSISPEINALGTVMVFITVCLPLLGGQVFRLITSRRRKSAGAI